MHIQKRALARRPEVRHRNIDPGIVLSKYSNGGSMVK